jgi:hypothetical protein
MPRQSLSVMRSEAASMGRAEYHAGTLVVTGCAPRIRVRPKGMSRLARPYFLASGELPLCEAKICTSRG